MLVVFQNSKSFEKTDALVSKIKTPLDDVWDLRFWCVVGVRTMSDVLSTVEHSERQSGQEVSRRQIPGYRTKLESSLSCQVKKSIRNPKLNFVVLFLSHQFTWAFQP